MTAVFAELARGPTTGIVSFDETVSEESAAIRSRLQNLAPVLLGPVAAKIREMYRKIFESEGSYAGEAWEPLAESTLEFKERHGYPDWILVREGDLMASLTGDERGSLAEMSEPDTLSIGTEDDAYKFHQHGTPNMPQRRITPDEVPDTDVNQWADLIADYVMEGKL